MDEIHAQEQAHLSEIYAMLVKIRTDLETTLNTTQKDAARDLRQMSEEIRPDFGGADETIETLAAIETVLLTPITNTTISPSRNSAVLRCFSDNPTLQKSALRCDPAVLLATCISALRALPTKTEIP